MPRLRRKIDEGHRWIRTKRFPARFSESGGCGARVLLGIGGNLGDVPRRFDALLTVLRRMRDIKVLESSPILKNPPFGYLDQPDFYNAVLLICTRLEPLELLYRMQRIERRFGRKRLFKDAPRTLDLDLIFYEKRRIERPGLKIPHPGWKVRDSVLLPMMKMKGVPWSKRHLKRPHPKRPSPWLGANTAVSAICDS